VKLAFKYIGFFVPLLLLTWGVQLSVSSVQGHSLLQNDVHRYGKSNFVPEWMPKSWVGEFLRSIHLDIDESLFSRSLPEMEKTLRSSPWIKEVKTLRRNFKGDLTLALNVRKPICVLKAKAKSHYMDAEGELLFPLNSNELDVLSNGEILPKVYVDEIVKDDAQDRQNWLLEVAQLINEWDKSPLVSQRLMLKEINMSPYRSKDIAEVRLKVTCQDRQFSNDILIEWGVHRDYNELEDRYSEEKWDDLKFAIGTGRAFKTLDLRYKKPDISF